MAIDNNKNGQPTESKEPVREVKQVVVPATLYAFGNRQRPRPPRPGKDIAVESDGVKRTQPPTGASTFGDIEYA